ncbi:MAG: NAD(P)-dependent oxidoreductase [Candidatus Cloacimonas sp.]|jgi:D-3-phosphoglycerate dehydrogenase|nr:NAD(P)-binding domain-containing protein [Candidatus Cloacimonadota bacterium]
MSKKILVATEKPFAQPAIDGISKVVSEAGYKLVLLENYQTTEELIAALADVQAVIVRSDKMTAEVIERAPQLEIIVRAGAGYDNVDLAAATKKNIVVMNTPGQNANAVAELAYGMMLNLARKGFTGKSGSELKGKTMGIHAYGAIGRRVAEIARGFGMEVIAFRPTNPVARVQEDGTRTVASAEELYSSSDYISLNLPKNKETTKSINFELMSKMKKGAAIINTARAEIIDEEGLLKMFEERPDFKYASDIAPECKAEIEEKYAGRFFFTPKKMGAQTEEANVNAGIAAASQIVSFFKTGDKTFQVNK